MLYSLTLIALYLRLWNQWEKKKDDSWIQYMFFFSVFFKDQLTKTEKNWKAWIVILVIFYIIIFIASAILLLVDLL
jgi:Na+/glutamate symporter